MKLNQYIILFLILFIFVIIWYGGGYKCRDGMTSGKKIELVIARYNEDLNWLKNDPFNKYSAIVYNKGVNDDFYKTDSNKVIKLENVGRCDHTYLYHIIQNYDNLADVTIFLPGSADMSYKIERAKRQVLEVEKHKNTVFIGSRHNDVKTHHYNFQLDEWKASDSRNYSVNSENKLLLADIRPFGKWYESHFKDIVVHYVVLSGIFAVSREHIRQHPKSYYEKFIKELSTSSNPEVGHYFERSWNAIFYPLEGAVFIETK
jgi:hypothetical protein